MSWQALCIFEVEAEVGRQEGQVEEMGMEVLNFLLGSSSPANKNKTQSVYQETISLAELGWVSFNSGGIVNNVVLSYFWIFIS